MSDDSERWTDEEIAEAEEWLRENQYEVWVLIRKLAAHAYKSPDIADIPDVAFRWEDKLVELLARRLRGGEGEREGLTPEWLKENLPRDWNYRIHVRGVGGVTIRAWDYEVPETEEYVAEVTQVDPRETRDDRDLLGQIKLGLERIASRDPAAPDREPEPEGGHDVEVLEDRGKEYGRCRRCGLVGPPPYIAEDEWGDTCRERKKLGELSERAQELRDEIEERQAVALDRERTADPAPSSGEREPERSDNDLIQLAQSVYEGLSDEEIEAVERAAGIRGASDWRGQDLDAAPDAPQEDAEGDAPWDAEESIKKLMDHFSGFPQLPKSAGRHHVNVLRHEIDRLRRRSPDTEGREERGHIGPGDRINCTSCGSSRFWGSGCGACGRISREEQEWAESLRYEPDDLLRWSLRVADELEEKHGEGEVDLEALTAPFGETEAPAEVWAARYLRRLVDRLRRSEGARAMGERMTGEEYDRLAEQFNRETMYMAPGKDAPTAYPTAPIEERREAWRKWLADRPNEEGEDDG